MINGVMTVTLATLFQKARAEPFTLSFSCNSIVTAVSSAAQRPNIAHWGKIMS